MYEKQVYLLMRFNASAGTVEFISVWGSKAQAEKESNRLTQLQFKSMGYYIIELSYFE